MDNLKTGDISPHDLKTIFQAHLNNTMACGQALKEVFSSLNDPTHQIDNIKRLEETGDKLTAEAYSALEGISYSQITYITEQFIQRLDDIVDGLNDTARMIDICQPKKIEDSACDMLAILLSMIARLQVEIQAYPTPELPQVIACRKALKLNEESADTLYHNWRKKQHRILVLPLVEEANWTEILGILEKTTDSAYHVAVLLERITKYNQWI